MITETADRDPTTYLTVVGFDRRRQIGAGNDGAADSINSAFSTAEDSNGPAPA